MNTTSRKRERSIAADRPGVKRRRTNAGPGRPKRSRPVKPSIIREKIGNEARKGKRQRVQSPARPGPSRPQDTTSRPRVAAQKRDRASTNNTTTSEPSGKRVRLAPVQVPDRSLRTPMARVSPPNEPGPSDPGPSRPRRQQVSTPLQPNKLFPHQQHVQSMVRRVLDGTSVPTLRGGLVWHGTGTGKTVSSLSILVEYIRHKSQGKNPYLVVVSHRSNIKENGPEKYRRNLRQHFPSVDASALDGVHFLTYAQFANRLGLMRYREKWTDWKRRGMVVIIDESHVLTESQKPRVMKQNDATAAWKTKVWLDTVFRRATTQTSNAPHHIYCLTATPGATVQEFLKTINLVRPGSMAPLTQETVFINAAVKKMISYADIRNNYNIFPRPVEPSIRDVSVNLSLLHYVVICYSIGKLLASGEMKEHEACGEMYLRKARSLEDIMYTTNTSTVLKGPVFEALCRDYKIDTTGSVSISPSVNTRSNRSIPGCDQPKLPIISPKIQKCIKNVATKPGKQLLYITSHTHIPVVEAVLRQQYGFADASSSARRKQAIRTPAKRFLAISKHTEQAQFADYFNAPGGDNAQGEIVKILIVSGQNYMGLNVRGLRGIHATVPFVTDSAHTQFQGRGARAYGHSNLPREDRTTSAYMYESNVNAGGNSRTFTDTVSRTIESIGGRKMTAATLGHVQRGYDWLVRTFRQAVAHKRNLDIPMPRHYPLPSDIVRAVQVSRSQQNYAKFKERMIRFIMNGSS